MANDLQYVRLKNNIIKSTHISIDNEPIELEQSPKNMNNVPNKIPVDLIQYSDDEFSQESNRKIIRKIHDSYMIK